MADNEQIPDGAQPPAGQPHLGPTNNTAGADLPDEFDVEVTDAPVDGEEAPAEPVAEPKPAAAKPAEPKRPRGDPERRIGQAVARQREAETMAERLDRENRELMAEFETKDKATQTATARADAAERAAFLHHSTNVANETKLANIEYRQAVEAGDLDKQSAANSKIARLAVQQNEIDNWKATHPDPAPGARPAAETEPERPRQAKPAAEQPAEPAPMRSPDAKVQGWLDENPWFDPFNKDDYDKDMHLATVHYAADLERRLKASGRAAEINSDQYWGKVTNYLRTEFPDRFDGSDPLENPDVIVVPAVSATTTPPSRNARPLATNPRMPVMSKPNSVLPANGQQAPGARPAPSAVKVQMSPDEKEMAIKQWEAGAMGNHHKTGKPIATAAEAVDQLAWRKGRIALGRS